jgi:hypothetical protein
MKKLLCIGILCLSISGFSAAQQNPAGAQASKEDVERYLQVMHSREMVTKVMDAMSKPIHDMIHEEYLKHKDILSPDFEARENKSMDEMFKNLPWEEVLNSMVPVYQKHFTKGGIDALVAFYNSPTGQKVLRELPGIMAESMQNTTPIIKKYIDRMDRDLEEEIAAMIKEGQPKSGSENQQKNN